MEKKRLAVLFPGMGYTKDKPLLYYSAKLVKNVGYEIRLVEYHDLPEIVFNEDTLQKAGDIAFACAEEQLAGTDYESYQDILFIGKSIGTVVLAKYAKDHRIPARQIWYTPVEKTFSFHAGKTVAFIGDADPASDFSEIKRLSEETGIPLYAYPECNHSLECTDVDRNIGILRDVMKHTGEFVTGKRTTVQSNCLFSAPDNKQCVTDTVK